MVVFSKINALIEDKKWDDARDELETIHISIAKNEFKYSQCEQQLSLITDPSQQNKLLRRALINEAPFAFIEYLLRECFPTATQSSNYNSGIDDTPLHAAGHGVVSTQHVRLLLQTNPAMIYHQNSYLSTPLHIMISRYHFEGASMVVQMAMEQRSAAKQGLEQFFPQDVVQYIIDGFVPNLGLIQNKLGCTPLHLLSYSWGSFTSQMSQRIYNLLLDYAPSSLSMPNLDGDTPIQIAEEYARGPPIEHLVS